MGRGANGYARVESVTNRGVANTHFETKRRFTATDWAEVYKWILARGDFQYLNKPECLRHQCCSR